MNPPPNELNEDLHTRWLDGQLTPEESARMAQQVASAPELLREKEDAAFLRTLLREHLPVSVEPPSPEFFTSSVMEEIRRELPAPRAAAKRRGSWHEWLRAPWFAPLASAAVLALAFLIWRPAKPAAGGEALTQTYTPDPRIIATSYYSEEAEATVIDLQNLDAVPDDREIKAFDVASADPAEAGGPLVLFAANDTSRPVMVLSKDAKETPRVTVIH